MPSPSEPMMMATLPPKSHSNTGLADLSSAVPKINTPAFFIFSSVRAKLVTDITGITSEAPTETLATVGVIGADWCRGIITASTPIAQAVRKQAPRL